MSEPVPPRVPGPEAQRIPPPGRGARSRWALLLLVPLLGTLVPAVYNRRGPQLAGMPFFYWYQMLWIAGSVACTLAVCRATRSGR